MMNISLAQKPHQQPDYQLELIDDELLLFHPSQTTILYCNQTASLVWQLADGQHTVAEIIDLLKAAYPEAENIDSDIETTLLQFLHHGAIAFV
jgi:hypothetical protein